MVARKLKLKLKDQLYVRPFIYRLCFIYVIIVYKLRNSRNSPEGFPERKSNNSTSTAPETHSDCM